MAGKRYIHPINILWELVWCFPFVLWPTFPLLYLIIGRVCMAKLLFAGTSCTGCGRCSRSCPNQAIKMVGPKPQTPFWSHHCEVCLRCMGYCKFQAVQASHLLLVTMLFATSFVTAALIQDLVGCIFGQPFSLPALMAEVFAIVLVFFCLILCYYLFFGLLRIRPLQKLLTFLTFTSHYSRRYHVPETTSRELSRRHQITERVDADQL